MVVFSEFRLEFVACLVISVVRCLEFVSSCAMWLLCLMVDFVVYVC